MDAGKKELFAALPKVDVLLGEPMLVQAMEDSSRTIVKDAVQDVLQKLRQDIRQGLAQTVPTIDEIVRLVVAYLQTGKPCHLRTLVNATGTVLHTNLGRSVLSKTMANHVAAIAGSYSNLEYDLEEGQRGTRYSHVETLLQRLTGAEAALVVNNNAAAVMLTLAAMTKGKEVVISRGELVEIGGLFRIPEVISMSGAMIREVGTTNKTHLADYAQAVNEQTGAIMKVHTSNYRIIGFTSSADPVGMAKIAHDHGVPFIHDLGSGLLLNMARFGLPYEPTVPEAIAHGADIVTFSGDKLLGGPQAGIIVGKKAYIDAMKKHQLLRALRVDKMTLAALEVTLQLYEDEDLAVEQIPVLQMLALTEEACRKKAADLAKRLQQAFPDVAIGTAPCQDMVGGGSYPEYTLPGFAVTIHSERSTAEELKEKLHHTSIPIIGRVQNDELYLSVRTILADEYSAIEAGLREIL